MTRATERTDSEKHSFSHWAIIAKLRAPFSNWEITAQIQSFITSMAQPKAVTIVQAKDSDHLNL